MSLAKIGNKIFSKEVELSRGEVELESIKVLRDDISRMEKGISKLNGIRKEMKSLYLNSIDKVNTHAGDFRIKANELGMDANKVKEYKKVQDLQKELDNAFYDANKL